jgi:hypothetical protein
MFSSTCGVPGIDYATLLASVERSESQGRATAFLTHSSPRLQLKPSDAGPAGTVSGL